MVERKGLCIPLEAFLNRSNRPVYAGDDGFRTDIHNMWPLFPKNLFLNLQTAVAPGAPTLWRSSDSTNTWLMYSAFITATRNMPGSLWPFFCPEAATIWILKAAQLSLHDAQKLILTLPNTI